MSPSKDWEGTETAASARGNSLGPLKLRDEVSQLLMHSLFLFYFPLEPVLVQMFT